MLLPDKHFVVYGIFILETVQTVLSGADLYFWFAAGISANLLGDNDIFFTPLYITPFASFFDIQIVGSVISLSVQLFFVYRIRVLSRLCEKRSRWLCIIICLVTSSSKVPERPFHLSNSSPLLAQ
jgi:predicted membrane protein